VLVRKSSDHRSHLRNGVGRKVMQYVAVPDVVWIFGRLFALGVNHPANGDFAMSMLTAGAKSRGGLFAESLAARWRAWTGTWKAEVMVSEIDHPTLRSRVALNVALRCGRRCVAGQFLHVAE
jgi:hypothetical protein